MFLISGGVGRAEEASGRPGVSAAEERGGQKGFRDVNGKTAELCGGKPAFRHHDTATLSKIVSFTVIVCRGKTPIGPNGKGHL